VELLVPLATAFGLGVVLTPLCGRLARALGIVAEPSADRFHEKATPLLGGVAIWAATVGPLLLFGPSPIRSVILIGGTMVFLLGVIDDFVRLAPATKLIGQVVAATAAVMLGVEADFVEARMLTIPLTIVWIVGITNAVNLLDNMDGLAAGIVALSSGALAACSIYWQVPELAAISLLIAGASLGFLVWNFNPAKIFMGDGGALFLGFSLGVISIDGTYQHAGNLFVVLAVPLLSLAVPVFDTTFVTIVRKLNRRRISQGGRDHLSHRLVALGMTPRRAVLLLYAVSAVFAALSVAAVYGNLFANLLLMSVALLAAAVFGVVLGEVKIYRRVEPGEETGGKAGDESRGRPRVLAGAVANYLRPLVLIGADLVIVVVAYLAAHLIKHEGPPPAFETDRMLESLPVLIVVKLLFLWLFRVYRGFWRYFASRDVARLMGATFSGTAAAILVLVFLTRFEGYSRAVFIIDALLFFVLATGMRVLFKGLQAGFGWHPRHGAPAVILGAGDDGERCLRELLRAPSGELHALGFLDDDPRKKGRTIHGVPVLGTERELERIVREHGIREVVMAGPEDDEHQRQIRRRCEVLGIAVRRYARPFGGASELEERAE